MRLRQDTPTVEVPTEFYRPFDGYTDDAAPDPDLRRDQLEDPAPQLERVEPEPDERVAELPDLEQPVPYQHAEPAPIKPDEPERLPNDGATRTVEVGDDPIVILNDDPGRVSWALWVPGTSGAGIRLAIGRHAREDCEQDGLTIPIAAGSGTLRGNGTSRLAARSGTPGTKATVHVIAERDTRKAAR